MKKIFLTLPLVLATVYLCNSQTIESEKVFGGYKFSQNGQELTINELTVQLNTNEESAQLIKKAKSQNTFATILGGAGGALIGYPVGTSIGGGEANWVLAGVGAGILAVAIPISASANKKTIKAVEIYNSQSHPKEDKIAFKPQLLMVSGSGGIGFALQF